MSVGEVEFLDVWLEAYAAIMRYTRAPDGFWVGQLSDISCSLIEIESSSIAT